MRSSSNVRYTINLSYAGRSLLIGVVAVLISAVPVAADRMTSPSFNIDTSVYGAPFGGQSASTNYKMVLGGGQSLSGSEASTSYKLGHGYVAQLEQSIQLTLVQPTVALGTITPGVSKTGLLTARINTDAPSYSLSIAQNANLTSGSNTIPAIPTGTIATPAAWTESTTKGLGLSLTGGPSIPTKWGTAGSYKYAAIPNATTTLYTRSGYTGGAQDTVTLQPRLDTTTSQATGAYSNTVTITATTIP